MFSFQGQLCWPPRDDGLLIPSNTEALLPLLPFLPSSSLAMQSSNTAQDRCSLLIVDAVWKMNPGCRWDGMMSWIEAKPFCTYFGRSRVPFPQSRVPPFSGNPDLISQMKKKGKSAGKNEHQCVNSLDAFACNCFSRCKRADRRLRDFLLSIRLKGRLSVHTFLTNIGCN